MASGNYLGGVAQGMAPLPGIIQHDLDKPKLPMDFLASLQLLDKNPEFESVISQAYPDRADQVHATATHLQARRDSEANDKAEEKMATYLAEKHGDMSLLALRAMSKSPSAKSMMAGMLKQGGAYGPVGPAGAQNVPTDPAAMAALLQGRIEEKGEVKSAIAFGRTERLQSEREKAAKERSIIATGPAYTELHDKRKEKARQNALDILGTSAAGFADPQNPTDDEFSSLRSTALGFLKDKSLSIPAAQRQALGLKKGEEPATPELNQIVKGWLTEEQALLTSKRRRAETLTPNAVRDQAIKDAKMLAAGHGKMSDADVQKRHDEIRDALMSGANLDAAGAERVINTAVDEYEVDQSQRANRQDERAGRPKDPAEFVRWLFAGGPITDPEATVLQKGKFNPKNPGVRVVMEAYGNKTGSGPDEKWVPFPTWRPAAK